MKKNGKTKKNTKRDESPIETALRLGARKRGFTLKDLGTARGAARIGSLARTIKSGVRKGLLEKAGNRDGWDFYKATGKSPDRTVSGSVKESMRTRDNVAQLLEDLARFLRTEEARRR